MGLAHRIYLASERRDTSGLKRLNCKLPVSLDLPDGTQLHGTVIELSSEDIVVSKLNVQTLPEKFTISGLRNEAPLEASPIWVEGDLFGVQLDDCWNKLVWLETEFAALVKSLRPIEDD